MTLALNRDLLLNSSELSVSLYVGLEPQERDLRGAEGRAQTLLGNAQEELTRRIEDAVPAWTTPVNYVLLFVGIVASVAGIILLALPMANEYFRRPQPVWEPPVPGAYYPTPGAEAAPAGTVPAEAAPAEGAETEASVDITKPPVESTPSTAEPAAGAAESDEPDEKRGQPGTGSPPPAL